MKYIQQPLIKPTGPPLHEQLREFFEAGKAKWLYLVGAILTFILAINLRGLWIDTAVEFLPQDKWAATQGVIQKSFLIRVPGAGKQRTTIHSTIGYAFYVHGKMYESERVSLLKNISNPSNPGIAEHYVGRYPVGKQVTVYYWPHDPQVSILEIPSPATTANIIGFFIWTLFFVLSGPNLLLLTYLGERKWPYKYKI